MIERTDDRAETPETPTNLDTDYPPATVSAPPEQRLEQKLKANPDDADAKVDVGSDESMDASDPLAAVQPGQSDEPVPSSGFPQ